MKIYSGKITEDNKEIIASYNQLASLYNNLLKILNQKKLLDDKEYKDLMKE